MTLLHLDLASSAARDPQHPAIVFGEERVSYGALARQSDQVATVLQRAGVGVGARVGIYLDKSPRAIIAILGILKSGAAYVPLPADAPPARARWQVADARLQALVTTEGRWSALVTESEPALALVVLVDGVGPAQTAATVANWSHVLSAPVEPAAARGLTPESLAYMLYTSGSTGRPKGVMISHRAAANFVAWAGDCFQVRASDRLSQHAPLQFDLSIFDIFVAIRAGATLYPIPQSALLFPITLARFLRENQITIWYSVPSALVRLLMYGGLEQIALPQLRHVLFAGEVFPVKHLRGLMTILPGPAYHNLYGPTETNVITYYTVPEPPAAPLPLGKACAGHTLFVVGDNGAPVAPGAAGELWAAGPSLMRGYWGDEDRTRASFGSIAGRRAYRTGDWVREMTDGNLQFLGRRDQMIKSRGYRIEPGEIEHILLGHEAVNEAAVIAVPDDQIGNRLVAVVATAVTRDLTGALAERCAAHLPAYMRPGEYRQCDRLPKTATGKLDRPALQADLSL